MKRACYHNTVSIHAIDVAYVAELARLQLTPDEVGQFQKQLGDVLNYVQQVNRVDVSGVADPLADPHLLTNVLRADAVTESLPKEKALANAPARSNDLIAAPKIVE
ncbi:MAG: Asp-tRNA(Asn)/Glu-tRNA(Gln) amidotransferase subunit GatC [bacterium]